MQLTFLKGYPDRIGKRFAWCGNGTGPASYPNTGTTIGDPVTLPLFTGNPKGGGGYIDSIESGGVVSTDGTYIVFFQPLAIGARQSWVARWFAFTSSGVGAEATNGTNLSTKSIQISGLGGLY